MKYKQCICGKYLTKGNYCTLCGNIYRQKIQYKKYQNLELKDLHHLILEERKLYKRNICQ